MEDNLNYYETHLIDLKQWLEDEKTSPNNHYHLSELVYRVKDFPIDIEYTSSLGNWPYTWVYKGVRSKHAFGSPVAAIIDCLLTYIKALEKAKVVSGELN